MDLERAHPTAFPFPPSRLQPRGEYHHETSLNGVEGVKPPPESKTDEAQNTAVTPIDLGQSGHRAETKTTNITDMTLSALEGRNPADKATAVTSADLEQTGQPAETKTTDMTLSVLEDVRPAAAVLASVTDKLQDAAVITDELGQRVETTTADMTLNDLEEVGAAPSDVTPASDRRDLETTSDDMENVKTEERVETNVDPWSEEQRSPASEGFFLYNYISAVRIVFFFHFESNQIVTLVSKVTSGKYLLNKLFLWHRTIVVVGVSVLGGP